MRKKIASFVELEESLVVCIRLRHLLESHGFVFSEPRFTVNAPMGIPMIVLGSETEMPHEGSTATRVIVGAWLERGDKFEPMVTFCDLGSPEDDRVIFTLIGDEWVLTIHSLPETPAWFSDLVDALMNEYGKEPETQRGPFSWMVPIIGSALGTVVRALKKNK